MKVSEVADQALARVAGWTDYSAPRSLLYRRIGQRQRHIFQLVASINADYYGVSVTATLANGVADIRDIPDDIPEPAAIQTITVLDPGTSIWPVGHPITVVPLADPEASIPPRMILRDKLLIGIGNDVMDVASIAVGYTRQPKVYGPADGAETILLESPHDDLLVLDCAHYILEVSPRLSDSQRTAAAAELARDESMLMTDLGQFTALYTPTVSRFTRPPSGAVTAAPK